jgi:hypothetical protein
MTQSIKGNKEIVYCKLRRGGMEGRGRKYGERGKRGSDKLLCTIPLKGSMINN